MSENAKHEIEELFSAAIDDALTQRQQTELKRLLQHQPEMAEQLEALRRQRQLLCSLPVESAPQMLAEEIQARLERRLILDHSAQTQSLSSRASLARRRFIAAAAMVFVPLGLLGIVVYHIITPPETASTPQITAQKLLSDDRTQMTAPLVATAPEAYPFDAVLTLTAERPMPAAQWIKKQIFLKAMEHQTIPYQTAERTAFQIDCPAEKLADFMDAMAGLWERLSDSQLVLQNADAPEREVMIPHVRPEQIQRLALQTDKMPMLSAARQYASTNKPLSPAVSPDASDLEALTPEQLAIPQPMLAWPQADVSPAEGHLPHVRLRIEIRQAE